MKIIIVASEIVDEPLNLIQEQFKKPLHVKVVDSGELSKQLGNTVVLIPEHTPVTSSLLDKAPVLKLVQCGAGYDYVDLKAAQIRGIFVANAINVNKIAVAEHAFSLILALAKKIVPLHQSMIEGNWKSTGIYAIELRGKTLGIVGLGNIGVEVAKLGLAFGMRVLAVKKHPVILEGLNVKLVSLETLLQESDVISLNIALNDSTFHMIQEKEFNMMKPSVFLVNTSRGAIVDEEALYEALRTQRIAGAGLDVFSEEPLPTDSPIRRLENVILTPHSAASSREAIESRYQFFAQNAQRILKGQRPLNIVNQL